MLNKKLLRVQGGQDQSLQQRTQGASTSDEEVDGKCNLLKKKSWY